MQPSYRLLGSAAELYERYLVPAVALPWALGLIERAAPQSGERVLDIACGTGIVSRLIAAQMTSGRVVGLDINPAMLAVARTVPRHGLPIEWHEASVLKMPFDDASFDLCVCQNGLQFFPDRPNALREIARVLRPGGRIAFSVYTAIERMPVALALADAFDRHLGIGASANKRSEHGLTDADELYRLADRAGFHGIKIEIATQTVEFESVKKYAQIQLEATPMAAMVATMTPEQREAVAAAIADDLIAATGQTGELAFVQEVHNLLART
jgi:ubiquinone/menaquinone biosynthesis C-methylase UbiE